jgi:hypothetical protein
MAQPTIQLNARISPEVAQRLEAYIAARRAEQPDPKLQRYISKNSVVEEALKAFLEERGE